MLTQPSSDMVHYMAVCLQQGACYAATLLIPADMIRFQIHVGIPVSSQAKRSPHEMFHKKLLQFPAAGQYASERVRRRYAGDIMAKFRARSRHIDGRPQHLGIRTLTRKR